MGIPPIRIDCPFPLPQSLPRHPRRARILVRVNRRNARFRIEFPASRKLSDTLAGEGDEDEALASVRRAVDTEQVARKAREKRGKEKEREREREKKQKTKRSGEEGKREKRRTGWKSTEDPAELFCMRRTSPPSSFSTLPSARNSIFVSARVYTRSNDNNLPRQWEATLHRAPPVYIPRHIVSPPISVDGNELSSFEPSSFTDRALYRTRTGIVCVVFRCVLDEDDEDEVACTPDSPRVIRWCVYRASVGRGVTG